MSFRFFYNKGSVSFVLMGNPMNGAELTSEDKFVQNLLLWSKKPKLNNIITN